MNIVILDGYAVNPGDLSWKAVEALGNLTIYDRTPENAIIERAKDAKIILTNKVPLNAETIRHLPKCRYIGVLATGYNLIDLKAAAEKGIVVTNIPAYSTDSVAQNTFALLLAITNHAEDYSRRNKEDNRWSECDDFCYFDDPIMELAGKQMGIVGYGHIGQAVARVARAFGMHVAVYSSKPQDKLPEVVKMDLDKLFETSDVISLHCPLTPDTLHMVNEQRIALMKKSAILLNTGRGPLVDETALANALNAGRIHAAGVDVLSEEPPRYDNPLLSAKNCFITPHISWASVEARRRLIEITASNISNFLQGKPCNKVN